MFTMLVEPRASCRLKSSLPSCIPSPQISLFSRPNLFSSLFYLFFMRQGLSYYIALAVLDQVVLEGIKGVHHHTQLFWVARC